MQLQANIPTPQVKKKSVILEGTISVSCSTKTGSIYVHLIWAAAPERRGLPFNGKLYTQLTTDLRRKLDFN